ncbi:MAG: hypothetical protein ACREIF_09900 [Chthoniobacterales bacterium]
MPELCAFFEGERCPNPQYRYRRGDWDKRDSKKPLTLLERALLLLDEFQAKAEK